MADDYEEDFSGIESGEETNFEDNSFDDIHDANNIDNCDDIINRYSYCPEENELREGEQLFTKRESPDVSKNKVNFEAKRENAIKKITLAKIKYDPNHWKVAEAKIDLAAVYLNEKHFPLQAIKHATNARDQLLFIQKYQDLRQIDNFNFMLQNIYYVLGCAHLQNKDFKNAENCLQKAKLVSDETNNATKNYSDLKLSILSSLATVLSKLGRNGESVTLLEEALEINNKMATIDLPLQSNLNKQIASIELSNKDNINVPFALEACQKALEISVEINGEIDDETASLHNLKYKILLSESYPNYKDIEDALSRETEIYEKLNHTGKYISSEQMKCKVFLQQQKFSEAKVLLERVIKVCEENKGDMSLKTAELYELMGSVLYTEGKITRALNYFSRAEEVYRGKKKYKQKQEKLSKLIDMTRKASKCDKLKSSEDKLKERPRFN